MIKRKIIVLVLALSFISFLIILLVKSKGEPSLPAIPPISEPSPSAIPWQVYSNQEYGYTLFYPPNWQVEAWDIKQAAKLKIVPDGSIWQQAKFKGEQGLFEVLVWENKTKVPLRTWLSWFRHEDLNLEAVPEQENFEIGGLPAIRFAQAETGRGKPLEYIFFQIEDKVYEFIVEKEFKDQAVADNYDKMVSSFKFLEDEIPVEPKAEAVVRLAKGHLAQKLGINTKEIRLLSIESVDWSDTSLGCPKEGMFYAQVITPGYKITLEGRGKSYLYHSDYKRVVLCVK